MAQARLADFVLRDLHDEIVTAKDDTIKQVNVLYSAVNYRSTLCFPSNPLAYR